MSRYQFSIAERHAVWTVHQSKCYMCTQPIDLCSMQVDHVIPEHLLDRHQELKDTIRQYGLPSDFDLNSFENWLPTCPTCNSRKGGTVFKPVPAILNALAAASTQADKARQLRDKVVRDRELSTAAACLEKALGQGVVGPQVLDGIRSLVILHEASRDLPPSEPIRIATGFDVLFDDGRLTVSRGPFGVGAGPSNAPWWSAARCPSCGHAAWNGARCICCGHFDDGD